MNPMVRYTMARLGLFAVVAALLSLVPVPVNILVKLMVALLVSALLSLFLLRGMREQVAAQFADAARRRAAAKDRLRSALEGDEEEEPAQPPTN